jgi:hypothetical protein
VIWPFGKRAQPTLDPASNARRAALTRQKIDLTQPLSEMRWCVVMSKPRLNLGRPLSAHRRGQSRTTPLPWRLLARRPDSLRPRLPTILVHGITTGSN